MDSFLLALISAEIDRDYERSLIAAKLDKPKAKVEKFPTYGGEFNTERFALSEEGEKVVKNILRILSQDYPTLEFCPPLPSIVALLAHHLPPNDLLGAMRVLVRESVGGANAGHFFPTKLSTMMLFYDSFGGLVKRHTPKAFQHLKKIEEEQNISPFWIKWLNNFCTEILTLQTAFRMMDSYLVEGYKILYRYGIGAVTLRVPSVLKCLSIEQFDALFEANPFSARTNDDDRLSRAAYNFSFSRSDVKKFQDQQIKKGTIGAESFSHIDQFANSKCAPILSQPSQFIQEDHWPYVWSWIPKRLRPYDLNLLFSTENHGYFLETLYKRCKEAEPQLLFIETTEGAVFGAFLSEAWQHNTQHNKFFGTAESTCMDIHDFLTYWIAFLFTLQPTEEMYDWVGHKTDLSDPVKEKHVSENASLFVFGNYQYMAVGGGGYAKLFEMHNLT